MNWVCATRSTQGFRLISRPSTRKDETFLLLPPQPRIAFFLSSSFLVSGNLPSNSRMKSLEEISYFDGDASAVTADLANNVDVKLLLRMLSW